MRRSCSGLLVLLKAETGWRSTFCGRRHDHTPTAATAAAATHALLDFCPSFGQQLLLCVAVGQGANARVRLSFGGALFRLDAASWYAVALHQAGVSLVFCHGAGLGTGTQLVCHGPLRLCPSLRMIVLTLVAISALLSWEETHSSLFTTAEKHLAACSILSSQCVSSQHVNITVFQIFKC